MAEDIGQRLGGMFRGLRQKAEDAISRSEAAFARGKTAGERVVDEAGAMIVDAGHIIDDEVLDRAARAGKMHAVVRAAGAAQLQDLKEKASDQIGATATGQEARSLATVEQYAAARRYLGWITAFDVTDPRGTVIVPAGKELTEDDIRVCRETDLLSAVVYAAQRGISPADAAARKPAPSATWGTVPGSGADTRTATDFSALASGAEAPPTPASSAYVPPPAEPAARLPALPLVQLPEDKGQ